MSKPEDFQSYVFKHFEKWNFTKTESEIALMILKGFSLRDIAGKRGTTETTTRQQALSLYKKAAVDGRHQLSAFFMEHLLTAPQAEVEITPYGRNGSDSL
ncbi:helix-turn-helix transcriptional regulator [Bdellovibrio reynosensis]|uniref:Helix-turn-helix transcriptional regulator n=1 Tax=Bdellovibrio reynosensis TaxID=2835041 RepID=A0ABY4CCC8_9BACT|nr:helix-turn-helix transcriptional regulator [Bdellovibrio reynosensis]UOF02633.1 helix-turn-helix transcriptional regulator [Bdellovibrio reynosensis]